MDAVFYIHGQGGSAAESALYAPLFPGCAVVGSDYRAALPWDAAREIRAELQSLTARYENIVLIANSIGAYFAMCAGADNCIRQAYFISPIVDMENLILRMMTWANVTQEALRARGVIPTGFGEDLSWEYLCYVREHPVRWNAPTRILYGAHDDLTPPDEIRAFAQRHNAPLTVMENGVHWFHTPEQIRFLQNWLRKNSANVGGQI